MHDTIQYSTALLVLCAWDYTNYGGGLVVLSLAIWTISYGLYQVVVRALYVLSRIRGYTCAPIHVVCIPASSARLAGGNALIVM